MEEKQKKSVMTLDEVSRIAQDSYLKILNENRIKDLLKGIGLFYDQDVLNTVLIMEQNPKATCVKTFDSWQFYKRRIKKSELSIKTIAHIKETVEEQALDEDGNVYTKSNKKIKIVVGHVFDISQTEGKDYPYQNTNKETISQHFDIAKKSLEETIKGFNVVYGDIGDDKKSYTDLENKTIYIKNGMTLDETIRSLIKEVSYSIVQERSRDGFKGITPQEVPNIHELEAQCVEYAICSKTGLDLPDYNFETVNELKPEQLNNFKDNLGIVRSVTLQILSNFEGAIEKGIRGLDKKTQELEDMATEQDSKETKQKTPTKSRKREVVQC